MLKYVYVLTLLILLDNAGLMFRPVNDIRFSARIFFDM